MTAPVIEETEPADLPVEVVDDTGDELAVRFPVLVIEGLETSDRRTITPGSLTARALPLSLLVQSESSHGGDDPGPSLLAGRIDSLERLPGPEVVSPTTGEPFPDGVFVWTGSGVIDKTAVDRTGRNVADMVERGYLRGVSVDLVGLDYEIVGEEEGNPQIITHRADLAAATLVPIPAFGDAYVELDSGEPAPEVEGLVASAFPSWRSAEVGDLVRLPASLVASAAEGERWIARIPPDAADQIAQVIDTGEQRDAPELAAAIVQHIADNWSADLADDPDDELAGPVPDAVTASGDGPQTGGIAAISPAEREKAADEGAAMEDGSYPIRDRAELEDAIQSVGRAKDVEAARRHIIKRARALDLEELIPGHWNADGTVKDEEAMADIDQADWAPLDGPEPAEPEGVGMPDEPQQCTLGPEPATHSLIFAGGERFAPVCDDHDGEARETIAAEGFEVEQEVPITATEEEVTAE